jgi:hypothetical protein
MISVVNFTTNNFTNFGSALSSPSSVNNTLATSVWSFASFTAGQVDTLINTTSKVTITVTDMDDDRTNDLQSATDVQYGHIAWRDNDASPGGLQVFNTTNVAAQVWLGGDPGVGYTGTNTWEVPALLTNLVNADQVFRLSDGSLRGLSGGSPLMFKISAFDLGDQTTLGLQRGTNSTEARANALYPTIIMTNSSISIGTGLVENTANYASNLSASVGQTKIAAQFPSNYWMFASPFSTNTVGDLWSVAGQSNRIAFNALDADEDRAGDQSRTNLNAGWLVLHDDDTRGPSLPGSSVYDPFTAPMPPTSAGGG